MNLILNISLNIHQNLYDIKKPQKSFNLHLFLWYVRNYFVVSHLVVFYLQMKNE